MEAGRELDSLIAEKVMGHRVLKISRDQAIELLNIPSSTFSPAERVELVTRLTLGVDLNKLGDDYSIPHYSTAIADAWQVVEKLRANGLDFGFVGFSESEFAAIFGTSNYLGDSIASDGQYAATAPHAICLAALKAVELK